MPTPAIVDYRPRRWRMVGFLKFLGVVLLGSVLVVGLAGFFILRDPSSAPATGPGPMVQGEGETAAGRFVYTVKDGAAVATFTPFIPRDDTAFIEAVTAVVRRVYADDIVGPPRLVDREVAFSSTARNYFVFPVKQDTGEVHSVRIRWVAHSP